MMSFDQISEKLSAKGYRKRTAPSIIDNGDETFYKVYDFEHKKKENLFSVYLDEFDVVEFVEFTEVSYNRETREFSQKVTKFDNSQKLQKFIG